MDSRRGEKRMAGKIVRGVVGMVPWVEAHHRDYDINTQKRPILRDEATGGQTRNRRLAGKEVKTAGDEMKGRGGGGWRGLASN